METAFKARLQSGKPLVADGAMGTQLYARGTSYDQCFDVQNIDNPTVVEKIHRDYLNSGSELIETNTFGANRFKLAPFGLEERVYEINQSGARIARGAREICGIDAYVAGSVGPTGRSLEPYGQTSSQALYDAFHEQIAALLAGGIDVLILETFGNLREIGQAILAAHSLSAALPVIAQMTFLEDQRTIEGHTPEQVVHELDRLGVDVIGANCSVGSSTLLAVTQRLLDAGAHHVSAMPNAGWPTRVGDRVIYLSSPDYMADHGRRMIDFGAAIVGGCCGTTPAHIAALRRAIEVEGGTSTRVEVAPPVEGDADIGSPPDSSALAGKVGHKRVITVELRPPRGANPSKAIQGARLLCNAGADCVNVLDSAMARVRMSAMATCALIARELPLDTILHFTTRDRNLMAIQSDLIGAHALGIRNVLAVTGDPPAIGDYAQSKSVYDIDSIGLIKVIKQLNGGVDIGGNSIGTPTRFLVGCALNPTAEDLDLELMRFAQKLEAGADFVMTQPVYDADLFRNVLQSIGPIEIPILMGVLPLQNYRHAMFIHNELPGVKLTEDVLRRMELAESDGVRQGMAIAREMIEECGPLVGGLGIVPSFGRYETVAELVRHLVTTSPLLVTNGAS